MSPERSVTYVSERSHTHTQPICFEIMAKDPMRRIPILCAFTVVMTYAILPDLSKLDPLVNLQTAWGQRR